MKKIATHKPKRSMKVRYKRVVVSVSYWLKPALHFFMKAAAFIASIVTIGAFLLALKDLPQVTTFYDKTFQTNRYWEKTLNQLSVEANLSYFISKLGDPVISNNFGDNYREDIYINKLFYVTAFVQDSKKVEFYTITVRNKDFHPYIKDADIRLGVTPFAQIKGNPDMTGYFPGIHDFYYEEIYYRGNPGNYLTYVYATSNASPVAKDVSMDGPAFRDIVTQINKKCHSANESDKRFPIFVDSQFAGKRLANNRFDNPVTTVGFITPHSAFFCDNFGSDNSMPIFTPMYNQVRLLHEQ